MKSISISAVFLVFSLTVCHGAMIRVPADQPTIQAGIDAAVDGDTVLVADGTYTGDGNRDISFTGKAITVRSENGPETCIIDCEDVPGGHRGVIFMDNEGSSSRLSGFTITNGFEDGGGGMYCASASPTIDHCIITGNTTAWRGGGLALYNSNALISDCIISNNLAINDEMPASENVYGGGVYTIGGSPVFVNCLIENNTAEQWLYGSHEPLGMAGGIFAATATLINCVIAGNTANDLVGGGVFDSGSSLINCTITGNTGVRGRGGISCDTDVSVTRCIAWNNTPNSITGNPTVTYSDVEGGFTGEGNIDKDPIFVTSASGSYYLSHSSAGQLLDSPCIDAGNVPASDFCFETADGLRCLNELSTRTDAIGDSDLADLGFHYPALPATPTPTPTPECDQTGVSVLAEPASVDPGETFTVTLEICNSIPDILGPVRHYLALDVYGLLFFWPSWDTAYDYELITLDPGLTEIPILSLVWPTTGTTGNATFIALMTNETGTAALGTWGLAGFGWE